MSAMPMVVCDSSTLIHLAALGHLPLLRDFYGSLTVPAAVWQEVVEQGAGRPGVTEIVAARQDGWIAVASPANQPFLLSLQQALDDGEAEVIALAVEHNASLVLLDESEARRIAGVFGLEKTGAIGVLLRAKLEGKIPALKPELDKLRVVSGFWIDDRLYQRALDAAGEK